MTKSSMHQRAVRPQKCLRLLSFVVVTLAVALVAVADEAPPSRQFAVLIGVENYTKAPRLMYTINDVQQLANTLRARGGAAGENILEIFDTAKNEAHRPAKTAIMEALPKWLAKPTANDTMFVYFSGHGFRDEYGKLYLAPIDCDSKNAAATGIPVEWFREQVAKCGAGHKYLIIDSCHAGTEKSADDASGIAATDLTSQFEDMTDVITLASSTADQTSQIWMAKQQSLFSYWLNQGLRGHADFNGDTQVHFDELYNYVHRTVSHTAKTRFTRPQTPVRVVRSGVEGVPPVIRLQPQTLNQLLFDISEQMALAMEEHKIESLGVLEFTNDTKVGELLGRDFGLLGRQCAHDLQQNLMFHGQGSFSVVEPTTLLAALRKQRFQVVDYRSTQARAQLSRQAGGMSALAKGILRSRIGRVITLHTELLRTSGDQMVAVAGGTAVLNEAQWAMLGRSVQVQPQDRPSAAVSRPPDAPAVDAVVIGNLDRRSQGAHPMKDPSFPYRVTIMVDGRQREPTFIPTGDHEEMVVPLSKGEVYQVHVESRGRTETLMRLLVDGLNTLPEKEVTKGIETWQVAPRSGLDRARTWILDPKKSTKFAVPGFFTATGDGGQYREFKVVDAQKSVAARQQYTDQLGMISAAFFMPAGRSIGTGFGEVKDTRIVERKGYRAGKMLAVVHIRYVEPAVLEQLLNGGSDVTSQR